MTNCWNKLYPCWVESKPGAFTDFVAGSKWAKSKFGWTLFSSWVCTCRNTFQNVLCCRIATEVFPFCLPSVVCLRQLHTDKKQISVGFIGYPNVGKSSIINTLRSKKVCNVAPIAGETKVTFTQSSLAKNASLCTTWTKWIAQLPLDPNKRFTKEPNKSTKCKTVASEEALMSGNCPVSLLVLMDASTEALGCRFFYTAVDLCWARRNKWTSTRVFSFNFLSLGLFIQFGNEHRGLKTCPKQGQGERRGKENLSLRVGACQSREPKIRHARE